MKPILLFMLLFIAVIEVAAQERPEACVTHRNAPPANTYYWRPNTNVKVFFEHDTFNPEQRTALFAAMKTWSNTAAETGAGIDFSYSGEVERPATCEACLTVTRREVHKSDHKHYAFFIPLRADDDGLLVSARIDFDLATTKPQALEGFMAHELGHGLGLLDCMTCKKKKTIMNVFPDINKDNGLIAPSACDLEVVRQVYERQRRVDRIIAAEKH